MIMTIIASSYSVSDFLCINFTQTRKIPPSKSIDQNTLNTFVVGGRVLIPGIEYAVEGIRVGGTRKVKISPHLAYQQTGVPGIIPANAVLIYEIELLGVE
jgi:FKBP-type peptidyl-prolyl cis-trans isomerase